MDKYGDMPMSKVPMKARLRIRELGRSVRGDKGGPTAGDLVKSMKRRRMGEEVVSEDVEERRSAVRDSYNSVRRATRAYNNTKSGTRDAIKAGKALDSARAGHAAVKDSWKRAARRARNEEVEQVDESLGNFMADYGGKEMKVRAKDEEDARSRVGRRLKIPKSKQHKIVVWEPMTDAERRDFELDDDGEREYANRYGHDMARKADRLKQREKKRAGRRKQRNEDVEVAEAGMIGRTKPSRELNVQKDEKPHLAGVKSLKYQKRAAHKAERKKGKQDVKINPELDETVERAKRGVDMAKQRVLAAKQRVARAKARDLGQKRREMRNEDSEIEEGGLARPTDVDRSVERGTTGQNFQQKTLRKRAVERAARAGRTQSRESEAVKRQRRRLKRKAGLRKPTKLNR
jgi:hypothetical protein